MNDPRKEIIKGVHLAIMVDGEPVEEIDNKPTRKELIQWAEENEHLQREFVYIGGKIYSICNECLNKKQQHAHIIECYEIEEIKYYA